MSHSRWRLGDLAGGNLETEVGLMLSHARFMLQAYSVWSDWPLKWLSSLYWEVSPLVKP